MLPKGAIQCYCLKCKVFPGEDESASDKHAFRPGSLCSICTICEVNVLA